MFLGEAVGHLRKAAGHLQKALFLSASQSRIRDRSSTLPALELLEVARQTTRLGTRGNHW